MQIFLKNGTFNNLVVSTLNSIYLIMSEVSEAIINEHGDGRKIKNEDSENPGRREKEMAKERNLKILRLALSSIAAFLKNDQNVSNALSMVHSQLIFIVPQ